MWCLLSQMIWHILRPILLQRIQYNGYYYYCRRESLAVAKTEETELREMEKSKTNTEMYPG